MDKQSFSYIHTNDRLIGRYNIALTWKEFNALNMCIQNRNKDFDKIFIQKKSQRVSLWVVRIKNKWVALYYDKNRNTIATILPAEKVVKYLSTIDTYLRSPHHV